MASVALTALSMTIGFFFIFMGSIKLTPALNADVYKEMRKMFIREAKVFPFVNQTGWKPNAHTYRKAVGVTEVLCGSTLAIIPGPMKEVANLILFFEMLGAVYTHWALKEGLERMAPALVFSLLLLCRYIIYLQYRAKLEEDERIEMLQQRIKLKEASEKKED
ncbi:unnamed protein product [Owenia fusiformis]|uniref:Novel acetylcholine receptor chaperone n=1 Tax=Owenia fusiformis TaxID=6347 RepID=A0A8J1TBW9_OWEFU|nr:unnamed protein product [Owenia fusiformis]